jgi:iron complex outermembrane receptor protein
LKARFFIAMLASSCIAAQAVAQVAEPATAPRPNPASALELPSIDVISTTPLPGIGVPVDEVPANVQSATGAQIEKQHAATVAEYLGNNLGSVTVNESQGNPFQPDVSYRGFTLSPLLGVPQGLSVFEDGVRINEPLGDLVNWDLVPQGAISSINLVPGSNPVFGLNTLGGALSINTKSGREYPGGSISAQGGSFGTYNGSVEYGGVDGDLDYYFYGNYYDSDGWRDHSASLVRQLFGKVGYQTSTIDADLSYSFADNNLAGGQTVPGPMLAANDKLAYTWPDTIDNRLNFINLRVSDVLDDQRILSGGLYWRGLHSVNSNSNLNNDFDGSNGGTFCDGTTPATLCPAANLRAVTDTNAVGGTLQFTLLESLGSYRNTLITGASYDHGNTTFEEASQNAIFDPSRQTAGVGDFATTTRVSSSNGYSGLYATDTLSLTRQLLMTAAARYDVASIHLGDELGTSPGISGTDTFRRLNPAIGLNYNPAPAFGTYISYNQGMRAPTPVELTCANPVAPCPLPNAFVSDPPLQPVIARTWELGARGTPDSDTRWSAALFRADITNDIQFVSASPTGVVGFFTNIPRTRRQGVELNLRHRLGAVTVQAAYAFVDATYQSSFFILSPDNSSANASGDIQVNPGNRIPDVPRHNLKLRVEWQSTPALSIAASLVCFSSRYALGNENNLSANGSVPGYGIVNLDASYRLQVPLTAFVRVTNLFDRHYQTAAILGQNFFTGANFSYNEAGPTPALFSSPGAPFGIWAGLKYEFGPQRAAP